MVSALWFMRDDLCAPVAATIPRTQVDFNMSRSNSS